MTARAIIPPEVLPVAQAREEFSKVVRRFRKEGLTSEPVVFGSHRKPEAVTIPFEMYQALLPAIEDILLAETVRERLAQEDVPWEQAQAEVGVTQEAVDAVNLDDYIIEGA